MSTIMSTGIGKGEDAKIAATRAVKEALSKLNSRVPSVAFVYSSPKYDYQQVVDIIRGNTNHTPLIGCSSGGEFTESAVENQSVVVVLIASDTMKFSVGMGHGISGDEQKIMGDLVNSMPNRDALYKYRTGILLIDGLAGKGEEIAIAAVNALGIETKLAGGAAGDDLKFEKTMVFCNDEIATDAVSLCLIESKSPMYTGVKHGQVRLSKSLKATSASGSVLYKVNDRPAWEVWKEEAAEDAKSLGIDVHALKTASEIGSFLLQYELGLALETGEYKIRIPLSINNDGSLNFACTIPEGVSFNIMKSIVENQTDSARKAAGIAKLESNSAPIAGALIFDCVCRGLILKENFYKAIDEFKGVLGDIPLAGFETYGEICFATGEFSGFHNTTSVVLLIPKD